MTCAVHGGTGAYLCATTRPGPPSPGVRLLRPGPGLRAWAGSRVGGQGSRVEGQASRVGVGGSGSGSGFARGLRALSAASNYYYCYYYYYYYY